jgi:hypothetical protein
MAPKAWCRRGRRQPAGSRSAAPGRRPARGSSSRTRHGSDARRPAEAPRTGLAVAGDRAVDEIRFDGRQRLVVAAEGASSRRGRSSRPPRRPCGQIETTARAAGGPSSRATLSFPALQRTGTCS